MSATDLARVAAALGDPTRAAVCTALLDGRAWTAGELARATGVTAPTMSGHLDRLLAARLVTELRQGRHRYVALAGPDVAAAIEQLMVLAGEPGPPRRTLRAVAADAALRDGRTCYDHLAGRLGVAITEAMVARGLLRDDLSITSAGREWLTAEFAVTSAPGRRPLARGCLDWTERRPHLAGRAGAAVCTALLDRGWITRVGDTRAVRLTPTGTAALTARLGPSVVSTGATTARGC